MKMKTHIWNLCNTHKVTIQRALAELISNDEIVKIGGGRYTKYTWNREKE